MYHTICWITYAEKIIFFAFHVFSCICNYSKNQISLDVKMLDHVGLRSAKSKTLFRLTFQLSPFTFGLAEVYTLYSKDVFSEALVSST